MTQKYQKNIKPDFTVKFLKEYNDSNAKDRTPGSVYIPVKERGVPLMKHKAEFLLHENAESGKKVGVEARNHSESASGGYII